MQGSVLADWQKQNPNAPAFAAPQMDASMPASAGNVAQATAGQTLGLNVRPPEP